MLSSYKVYDDNLESHSGASAVELIFGIVSLTFSDLGQHSSLHREVTSDKLEIKGNLCKNIVMSTSDKIMTDCSFTTRFLTKNLGILLTITLLASILWDIEVLLRGSS